jgi:hypothetical protein
MFCESLSTFGTALRHKCMSDNRIDSQVIPSKHGGNYIYHSCIISKVCIFANNLLILDDYENSPYLCTDIPPRLSTIE